MKAIQSYLNLKPQGEPHERFVEILTEALSQRNYASSSQTDPTTFHRRLRQRQAPS